MITGGSSQAAERPSMLASRLAAAGRSLLALILWGVPGGRKLHDGGLGWLDEQARRGLLPRLGTDRRRLPHCGPQGLVAGSQWEL
jgi:hypothetical protein